MNFKDKKIAIIIPVRLASTRLPNKPLVDILGKTMIQRVYEKALESNVGKVFIACDGEEIANEVKKFNANFIITNPDLPSGTDRIYAAFKEIKEEFDLIINLQGDLPNINPKALQEVALTAFENDDAQITTLASIIKNKDEIDDQNIVKIAITFDDKNYGKNCGKALYFSRAAIPFSKNKDANYFHHIGIYAFKKNALEKFVNLKPSFLEKQESLEQLRALENDMKIVVKIVDFHPLSVDTKSDLEKIIKQIQEKND